MTSFNPLPVEASWGLLALGHYWTDVLQPPWYDALDLFQTWKIYQKSSAWYKQLIIKHLLYIAFCSKSALSKAWASPSNAICNLWMKASPWLSSLKWENCHYLERYLKTLSWLLLSFFFFFNYVVVVFQSLNHVQLFVTPWTAARQASLSSTISWSLLKLTSVELVMPSNCLILWRPLLLLPSTRGPVQSQVMDLAVPVSAF